MNTKELDSLFKLLDDPDPIVHEAVVGRLTEIGVEATVQLRDIIEGRKQEDPFVREAAHDAFVEIGLRRMFDELQAALGNDEEEEESEGEDAGEKKEPTFDLEAGAFAVALHRYPDLNREEYRSQLDTMADLLRWRMRDFERGIDKIREINYYLVQEQHWRGVAQNHYHDPDNSCLNRVLDLRRGIPVSMSVVWLLLAERLGLPLRGISFPVHFLTRYHDGKEDFLVDPFNGGVVVTEEQCKAFLESVGLQFHAAFLDAVDGRHIVARMMRNLAEIYRESEPRLAEGMERGIRLLTDSESGMVE